MDGFLPVFLQFFRYILTVELFLYFLAGFALFGVVLLILRTFHSFG